MPRTYTHNGRKPQLASAKYTADIMHLTAQDIIHYGNRIVDMALARSILETKYGRGLDRNIVIQACRAGKIRPMGRFMNKLYFWTHEVEQLRVHRRGEAEKEESDALAL